MKTVELNDRQLAHIIIALRKHEAAMEDNDDEEMGDALHDIIFVQGLIKKLIEVKET